MDFIESLKYLFCAFAGMYLASTLIFAFVFIINRDKETFVFGKLSFSVCAYTIGCLYFLVGSSLEMKLHVLFPLQCLFAGTAFYYYVIAISSRFNLKGYFLTYLVWFLRLLNTITVINILLVPFGFKVLFTKANVMFTNLFIANSTGTWEPIFSIKMTLLLVSVHVIAGNCYFLFRLWPMKLKGFHRLILWGIFTSFLANLNDNLMGLGAIEKLFPLLFMGYIFEIVYFLIVALRTYSQSDYGFSTSKLGSEMRLSYVNGGETSSLHEQTSCPMDAMRFVVKSLKEKYFEIDATIELNFSSKWRLKKSEEELLSLFFHLLTDIFERIKESPQPEAHVDIYFDNVTGQMIITETSPSNYKKGIAPTNLGFHQLKRILAAMDIGLNYNTTTGESVYRISF